MTFRVFILALVIAAAASGGWKLVAHARPSQADTAAHDFGAAAGALESYRQTAGTYAGAEVPIGNVVLVRADAATYCLQTQDGLQHELGPAGAPAAGPC